MTVQTPTITVLVPRYYAEVDAFNTRTLTDASTDEDAYVIAEATYNATLRRMIGVPARTADDALAAIDWFIKECADTQLDIANGDCLYDRVAGSLVNAVRDYIASTAGRPA